MKRLLVFLLIILASNSYAGEKKKSQRSSGAEPLEAKWDADQSLMKLDCNDNVCIYGIKGTAIITDSENDLRSAWVGFLYKRDGRKALKGQTKGSYYSKEKWNFNCGSNRLNVSSMHYYDAKGNPLTSFTDEEQWSEIVPGSFGETVAKLVCSLEDGDEAPAEDVPGEEPAED